MYDEEDDWELPEPDDEEDSVETVPCPNCGEEIYEEAEQCPFCGQDVTHSTSPWSGRPLWFVLLGLAGIVAAIVVLAHWRG